jgi:glycosyltransferase involved in cell wall biosynthesis
MSSSNLITKESCFFSIIIATYNIKKDLINCISSINNQYFTDYELLVSDGGSTDGTAEYLASKLIHNLTWYKSAKDDGIYDALNTAIEHASGKWILVLGADDTLANAHALFHAYIQIQEMKLSSGIAYSDLYISTNKGIALKQYPAFSEFDRKYNGGAFIHHQSAFVARNSLISTGKFSLQYKIHADYDSMLKISKLWGAVKIDGAYVVFSSFGYSSKISRLLQSFFEVFTIRQSHGYLPISPRLLVTYSALVIRRIFPFFKL